MEPEFTMNERMQGFESLKKALTEGPCLAHADLAIPFVL